MAKAPSRVLSALEMEFLSEDELITIIPRMKMDEAHLICGSFGPFQPAVPTQVPLWFALSLKKRQKCTIQSPPWMKPEFLKDKLEKERQEESFFEPMPFHYMEIATQLIENAPDDIENMQEVRLVLEDIWECRSAKIRKGLQGLEPQTTAVKLKNLSGMEINGIRPFFVEAMNQFFWLSRGHQRSSAQQSSAMGSSAGVSQSLSRGYSQNPYTSDSSSGSGSGSGAGPSRSSTSRS